MIIRKKCAENDEPAPDSNRFSGKRQAVVDKIVKDIAARIIQIKTRKVSPDNVVEAAIASGAFAYNTFTAKDGKVTRTMAPEAADFLIESLERLAGQEATDSEMEIPDPVEGQSRN